MALNTGLAKMESALTTTMEIARSGGRTEGIAAEEFESLVRLHQKRVYQVLFALVRDRDLADTLTQDCFLHAFQGRATFRGESAVERWLVRIAVNLARDHLRNRRWAFWREAFARVAPRQVQPAELDVADPSPSAERALLAREQLAAAEAVLEKISPRQRLAFSLRFFEEMSLEEIAQAMQLEVGTVKVHLFRAVSAVRKKLR